MKDSLDFDAIFNHDIENQVLVTVMAIKTCHNLPVFLIQISDI